MTHAEQPVQRARSIVIAQRRLVMPSGLFGSYMPLFVALIGRRRRTELALRVRRDGRPESGEERVARVAGNRLVLSRSRVLVQVRRVDRLRDAAPVLARRAFGARQRAWSPVFETDAFVTVSTRPPAASVPDRKQIERVDAEVARVAAVAPLHVRRIVALRIERRHLRRRAMPLPRAESRSRPYEFLNMGTLARGPCRSPS